MFLVALPYRATAAHYYAALHDLPWAVWLDSGGRARFDILSAAPQHTIVVERTAVEQDVFALLRPYLKQNTAPALAHIPFAGGALGYWSYDLAVHQLGLETHSHQSFPDMAVGIYDWALVIDHQQQSAQLVSHQHYPETATLLRQILERLMRPVQFAPSNFQVSGEIRSNFTAESYVQAFAQIQHYLHAGDCYQINLAQHFQAPAQGDAFAAYLDFREQNPAPYGAFLNLPHAQILSASPECFIEVQQNLIQTKPIKGTRPRGQTAEEDACLATALRQHPKDRAENLMIVDLLRNDLNRNCVAGSVCVPKLFDIESYSNVHHLVSTIQGQLRADRDVLDLLRDSFPGGSITGAPKRRAIEIIHELEPDPRMLYCGCIGYIGFDGNMASNIAIRTLIYTQQTIHCWAGGGIVADSQVESEYQETFDKAAGMLNWLIQQGGQLVSR